MSRQPPDPPAWPWASSYRPKYESAYARWGNAVDRYLHYTEKGDPLADAVIHDLATLPPAEGQKLLTRAIEHGIQTVPEAPQSLRNFFEEVDGVPIWVDWNELRDGCDCFLHNADIFLMSFVAYVLPIGFGTNINKCFHLTGRVTQLGVNRLKANNRQLVESFMIDGLRRRGDGFKLTLRVRLVHAQVRRLLLHSPEWNRAAWGLPLSAAHMAYAYSAFSAMLLKNAIRMGAEVPPHWRRGFMANWKYQAFLMGIPAEFLTTDPDFGVRTQQVGWSIEPDPDEEARIIVHSMINSAPVVGGIEDPVQRRNTAQLIFNVSRTLVGDPIADQLAYPRFKRPISLNLLRLKLRGRQLLAQILPGGRDRMRLQNLETLFNVSQFKRAGFMDFALPQKVKGWIQRVDDS
ncbi:MAG: oxygenase MpaB family protein [Verrucomicrobiia bacterium]